MPDAAQSAGAIRGRTAQEIAGSIEAAIDQGKLEAGEVLPSVRRLADRLGVSPMTVSAAFKDLRLRGLVTTHERRRTRVAARPAIVRRSGLPIDRGIRDLASDNPDPAFLPALGPVLGKLDLAPQLYGRDPVLPALRARAARDLEAEGIDPTWIAVLSGTFDAIERALGAYLKPGDGVAVEDPGYTGVLDLVRTLGLQPVGMRVDARGVMPKEMARALKAGVRACVLTPRAQNPVGAAFDERRAAELRRVLVRHPGVLLIEDDHAGPVSGQRYHSLVDGHGTWVVVRSVSKSLGPDLRLAVIAGDRQTISRIEGRQLLASGWVSYVLQTTVEALWRSREVKVLVRRAGAAYTERRSRLIAALAERGIDAWGRSGLNVWVPVAEEGSAIRGLFQLGWAVTGGEIFRIDSAPGLRITTASLPIAEVARLADDVALVLSPSRVTSRA